MSSFLPLNNGVLGTRDISGAKPWFPDHVGPPADPQDYFGRTGIVNHPLVLWAAVAGIVPQTLNRVPRTIAGSESRLAVRQLMVPLGIEEQLSLPLFASGRLCRSFVVAQADRDFTRNDLTFAQRVQPTLLGLARQVAAVRRWESIFSQAQSRRGAGQALAETRLTGSELAVLQLLGQGLTATAMANRLGVTPRTVHKHLQHVYAKLRTPDRLTAVITARRLGILTEQEL